MTKWRKISMPQYHVGDRSSFDSAAQEAIRLNNLTEDGWRLVAVTETRFYWVKP